jgi:23S rRNA U2552 (ribose-2'-O)-methylase RlmE/FtsJ
MYSFYLAAPPFSIAPPLLKITPQWHESDILVNHDAFRQLSNTKNNIDANIYYWEKYKKMTHPYEYIHINTKSSHITSVANIDPISRAFFKLHEIIHTFLPHIITAMYPLTSLHLCEAPGGFLANLRHIRNYNTRDALYAISIAATHKSIPTWHKATPFLHLNPQITILHGIDNTGNLYNPLNIIHIYNAIGTPFKCQLITADGGFDFTTNFNLQEINMAKLIYAQIITALINQARGGSLVLKIFDINYLITCHFIQLLQAFYSHVHIFKPAVSRLSNSEKYLICINYTPVSIPTWSHLLAILAHWNSPPNTHCTHLLPTSDPGTTLAYITAINSQCITAQIEKINETLHLIHTPPSYETIQHIRSAQLRTAADWCSRFNLPVTT